MQKLVKNRKGIINAAIGIGVAAIVIIIVMFVWANLTTSLPPVTSTIYNDTKAKVDTNIGTGMTLLGVGLIIAAALVILALVMRVARGGGGGGEY